MAKTKSTWRLSSFLIHFGQKISPDATPSFGSKNAFCFWNNENGNSQCANLFEKNNVIYPQMINTGRNGEWYRICVGKWIIQVRIVNCINRGRNAG